MSFQDSHIQYSAIAGEGPEASEISNKRRCGTMGSAQQEREQRRFPCGAAMRCSEAQ
jgi:hypothetical protein